MPRANSALIGSGEDQCIAWLGNALLM